jgi:3-methyl-2-oxobutanoate hydroxymethyltransferase
VARSKPDALVAVDVPFAEAHYEFDRVLSACQQLVQKGGAEAVKIEGGALLAPVIARLVEAGVAVWGHIGLKPQQVHALGRYRKFGTSQAEADSLIADAIALEKAGVFALLIEMVDAKLAKRLSETVKVPVVGIGSGPHCDGQILVYADMLGLSGGYVPGFARQFADAGEQFKKGFAAYAEAVRERKFPEP